MAVPISRDVLTLLQSTGAFLEGHFLLSSGKHTNRFIQCAKLLQYPALAHRICLMLAEKASAFGTIDAVIGPALGGIIVAYELARCLEVRGIFTERKANQMTLPRGFQILPEDRVLIAEDVVTTGRSSLEVAQVVTAWQGRVMGIACIVDRQVGDNTLEFPVISLARMELELYDPEDCPLCRQRVPCIEPGSRRSAA